MIKQLAGPSRGISRRTFLRGGLYATGAALASSLGVAAGTAFAQAKVSKVQAQNRGQPNDGQQCSGCVHFQEPAACALVEGDISPQGWCTLYSPKG
jgi:hypothetical protein